MGENTAEFRDSQVQAAREERVPEADQLAAVAFVGRALAPLFLEDPLTGAAGASLEAMASLDPQAASQEWPFVDGSAALDVFGALQSDLASCGGDYMDLAKEYRRLFVGPAKKVAPPWGSVYTDRECVTFGVSTLELRRWMREHGIARLTDERTPEDSIGLMLNLMAWIAEERPELLDEYLRDHLLTWAPHFLEIMEAGSERPAYRALAQLTKASLEGIQRDRGISVTYPRFYR